MVDHGAASPWASKLDHHHEFPRAEEVVSSLNLDESQLDRVRVDALESDASARKGSMGFS